MADNTHETKLVISGDASGATSALKRVQDLVGKGLIGTLHGLREAVSKVMGAFGLFGLAVQGVQALIEGFKKIHEWMNRAAKAAAEMRIAAIFKDAADAMDRLISRQETYNKLLKEELDDLSRRKELQNIEQSGKEQRENEKREIARAKEIAGATSEEEERKIRQRWVIEDETRERGRRYRQLKSAAAEEDEKAAIYGSKAGAAEENVAYAGAAIEDLRASKIRMSDEQKKEADKQIAALEAKRKASAAEAEQYRIEEQMAEKRAALYRRQIEDVRQGGGVAQAKNDAENAKLAREKEKKKADDASKRQQNLEDKQLDRRREEELARLDPTSPTYERDKKEIERNYEIKAAETKRDRATNAEDRRAAEEELKTVQIRQDRERGEGIAAQTEAFVVKMATQADSSRPKDRLTAMGLGSGAAIDRTAQQQAADVKTLVQLLKEQVNLTREKNQANVAVYTP